MRKKRLPGGRGNAELERNRAIYELRKQGERSPLSLKQVGVLFNLSHQRVAQIVEKMKEKEGGDKVLHKV